MRNTQARSMRKACWPACNEGSQQVPPLAAGGPFVMDVFLSRVCLLSLARGGDARSAGLEALSKSSVEVLRLGKRDPSLGRMRFSHNREAPK